MPSTTSSSLLLCATLLLASTAVHGQYTNGYKPTNVTCPSRSLIRNAGTNAANNQTVNPDEASYIQRRKQQVVAQAFQDYLGSDNATGYDLQAIAPNATYWPTVGIAVSGGGYRAALVGAGTFQALDGRNQSSVQAGTGGIMQLASYMTGLSGGSWFVSSLAVNNVPQMEALVLGSDSTQGWFLEYNLILPDGVLSLFDNRAYYNNIEARVDAKMSAGFNTSITDAWGIALAYHFGPGGTTADNFYDEGPNIHNTAVQYGQIRNVSSFSDYSMPFPAVTANSRPPNYFPIALNLSTVYIPLNSTVYEFNPYEMGSYDPNLHYFVELDYAGTNLFSGRPLDSNDCVNGYSSFAYTIATSSSLFNAIVQTANATLLGLGDGDGVIEGLLDDLLANIGGDLRDSQDDLAIWPNSFQGLNPGTFPRSSYDYLELVDGGENGANIPLDPLLVKARGVDTIIAVDGSADTDTFWPNATSLRASYARAATLADGYQTLPYFPSAEVFVQQGLNQRPTFFGCNASQSEIDAGMPMILYLPNSPLGEVGGYYTNVSTYTLEYSREDTQSFLNSMWGAQTRGYPQNGAATDDQFKTCLSCGLLERRRQAAGLSRSSACEQCFSRYCYDAAPADGGSMAAAFAAIPNAVYNQDDIMHP